MYSSSSQNPWMARSASAGETCSWPEHLALETLGQAGIAAARTALIRLYGQTFLEVERFDRVGGLDRRGLVSLAALDAGFADMGGRPWPEIATALAAAGPGAPLPDRT